MAYYIHSPRLPKVISGIGISYIYVVLMLYLIVLLIEFLLYNYFNTILNICSQQLIFN